MLTPRDPYMLQQVLFDFHLRSIEEKDYDKAARFSLLMQEVARNWRRILNEPGPKC